MIIYDNVTIIDAWRQDIPKYIADKAMGGLEAAVKAYLHNPKQPEKYHPFLMNMTALVGLARMFPYMMSTPSQMFMPSLWSDDERE